ncbi:MAG TPA: Hpt domain-containing protein [Thiotrichaceae bacterium]|nr:Hpt domain-containing protein [Thiotrichaceae bacterium]
MANSAVTPTLDLQMLAHLEKIIGHEMMPFLTQQFLEYASQQLQALQDSLKIEDIEAIRQQAHQFKGESLQIGANQLGVLCQQLESQAEAGQLESASAHLIKLKTEFLHLKKALSQVNNDD